MPTLKLYLFGSPRLEADNTILKITRRKAMALLSYLAVTAKTHERDALATLFWPESSQSQARMALSRHLSELNGIVPEDIFTLQAETVSLRGILWLDVAEFTTALSACTEASVACLPVLQEAVTLYHDDFLAGFTLPDCPDFDSWQFFQAESLRQQFAATLEKLVQFERMQGDYEGAIAHARRWLALDPLDEAAHRSLMQLYAQSGQQAAALRQYEQCRQILQNELGIAPAEQTTAWYEAIRHGSVKAPSGQPPNLANRYHFRQRQDDLLGQGAMGQVYRGTDSQTGQPVAIKVLKTEVMATNPELLARFIREGEVLRQLNHPNIVKLLDTAEQDGQHFLVLEYVGGGSLRQVLDQQGKLALEQTLSIGLGLSDALTRAHQLQIIHRDLKPGNVLLAEDGTPRLTDFGVAQLLNSPPLTQTGAILGTLDYLSPEACQGEGLDTRTDIWALGILLFEMLSGQHPFRGETMAATWSAILSRPLPDLTALRADIPPALIKLLQRMLAKDPAQRLASMRQVGAELEAILQGRTALLSIDQTIPPIPSEGLGEPKPSAPKQPLVAHNLPTQTTPFIGRERELAELTHRLADPDTRLVTIIGPGGMGKTRLAQQAGRRLLERFADGVWFLSLAAVDATSFGPALNPLLNGLAGLFGLRLQGGSSPQEQVLTYLQSRQMLLIFDNLEHLLAESEVLSQLLSGAPEITLLTTSRERLNLQEEWLFPLEGLALTLDQPPSNSPQRGENHLASPPLGGTEGGLTEAVQLFQQTAQRLQPGFDLHAHLNAVAQICHLVEGMPLGIELAASWVRYMSPAEIAQEIEKDIDFLATNVRNLPARHRSLRAVFDHSWRLLSPQEQEVLPQLAIFRGGFRLAEVQAVTGASRLMLTALVDKSLIAVSAEGRYDLHERLRQYLLEKLRQDLALYQAANDRHSQVYLALLQLDPTEISRQRIMQGLTADFDNIRAAWHWALDQADWSAIRRSRRGLHVFLLHKSWFLEENAFYERAISRLEHQLAQPGLPPKAAINMAIETATETEMQLLLAALHCDHIEVQARLITHDPILQTRLDENLNILRALGPIAYPELADLLSRTAQQSLRRRIDHEALRRYGQEALPLCQVLGDLYGQTFALQGLGAAALFAGQFASAAAYAEQLSALAELGDNPYCEFATMELWGYLARDQGDYHLAEDYYGQAYHLIVSIDPVSPAVPFVLAELANIARLQGDYTQARAYLQQMATTEQPLGLGQRDGFRPHRHHKVLLISGYLAEAQGDLSAAQQAFAEIWQQDRGHSYFSSAALIGLGRVALKQQDWSAARQHFATAFPLTKQLETAPQALEVLAGVAYLQAQAGQLEQALTLIGLVYHHPSSYQETKDRLADLEAELRAVLPPEQVQAALARGQAAELWETVVAANSELDTLGLPAANPSMLDSSQPRVG